MAPGPSSTSPDQALGKRCKSGTIAVDDDHDDDDVGASSRFPLVSFPQTGGKRYFLGALHQSDKRSRYFCGGGGACLVFEAWRRMEAGDHFSSFAEGVLLVVAIDVDDFASVRASPSVECDDASLSTVKEAKLVSEWWWLKEGQRSSFRCEELAVVVRRRRDGHRHRLPGGQGLPKGRPFVSPDVRCTASVSAIGGKKTIPSATIVSLAARRTTPFVVSSSIVMVDDCSAESKVRLQFLQHSRSIKLTLYIPWYITRNS